MKDFLSTFLLIFLIMGGLKYFDIKIVQNVWIESVIVGIVSGIVAKLIEKLCKI